MTLSEVFGLTYSGFDTSHPVRSTEYEIRSTGRPDVFSLSPGPLAFISKGNNKEKSQLKKNSSIEDWAVVGQHCPCHNKHNEKKRTESQAATCSCISEFAIALCHIAFPIPNYTSQVPQRV